MNSNKIPLISICIPTYNRVEYLKDALANITSDESFDERVEIVISDNASTDETECIVEKYKKQYPNITYYKNKENLKDENFILALLRGKGKYVRLFNDTLRLQKGALGYMLKTIENSSENTPLFFYQNISFLKNTNNTKHITQLDHFLNETSFYVTWIGNFGSWKKDIMNICNPTKCSELQLAQVDWTYDICKKHDQINIHFADFFLSVPLNKKGGYNLYKVFIENYFKILNNYEISFLTIQKEKFRLLKNFIIPWLSNLKYNKEFTFQQDNKWKIIFNTYWTCPYFYYYIICWWSKGLIIELMKKK